MRYFVLGVVDIDEATAEEFDSKAEALKAAKEISSSSSSIAGPFVLTITAAGQCKIEYVSSEEDED